MRKIFHWLDDNILGLLAGFLLVFIPLYPKWPLFDILYGYNVRVRLEDFFVAATLGIYVVWLIRGKVKLNLNLNPVAKGLIAYLVVGLASVLTALFITQTIPIEYLYVAKTFLHWLRRVEYLSLFFVFFTSVKSPKQIKAYLILFFITLLGVIIYGYGQKYLYWPAFSTMNREFSKGWWLYLTGHARVLSTFGGHYDLAGYLVIALTLSWSFFFGLKKIFLKVLVGALIGGGFWLLILTASRISFAGYILGLSVVVGLWTFRYGLKWGISRLMVTVFLSMLIMLSFGDLSDRFLTLFKFSERFSGLRAALLSPTTSAPTQNAAFLENNIAAVTSKTDQPPTLTKPTDVNKDEVPLLMEEKTASGATILVEKQRTYSQNALMYDLSTGIRLDTTWPRAIAGFKSNPLLGKGYATLSQSSKYDFSEAESTDNGFLRALGETGALGFITYYGSLALLVILAFRSLGGIIDPMQFSLVAGFIGLTLGLLVNAMTIDIFESSKVAYMFWGISGLTMGNLYIMRDKIKENMKPLRLDFNIPNFITNLRAFLISDKFWLGLIVLLLILVRSYKFDGPIADWHSWRQADTSAVSRNFLRLHKINLLYPVYDDLSSVASGKANPTGLRMVEFPIYNAVSYGMKEIMPEWTIEESGRAVTILASAMALIFLFLLCRKYLSRRIGYFSALAFALFPFNIFYGRSILPDPSMVAMSLAALWFGSEYISKQKKRFFVLSCVCGALALLIKPYGVFVFAPLGYLWFKGLGVTKKSFFTLALWFGISAIPLLLWRYWISQFPQGIPASGWLLNGDGIRFKGAFWYWLFGDRMGRLILGYWGLVLVGIGLVRKNIGKFGSFPTLLFLSAVAYLIIFATGNVRHDYYQILLVPSLAVLAGLGLDFLVSYSFKGKILALVCAMFTLGFGWYFVRDFYNINHPEIVEAGVKVKELTNWKALVVAPYEGDTAFLYQTDRQGWPIMEGTIDQMIEKGAHYYVSTNLDQTTKIILSDAWPVWDKSERTREYPYKLLVQTDKYVIIQLVPDTQLPR